MFCDLAIDLCKLLAGFARSLECASQATSNIKLLLNLVFSDTFHSAELIVHSVFTGFLPASTVPKILYIQP